MIYSADPTQFKTFRVHHGNKIRAYIEIPFVRDDVSKEHTIMPIRRI